jgi:predicted dehydrogenase
VTANKIVRVGIIGAGFAKTTQIPAFQNCEGARVVAIASGHREHAAEVARQSGIPNVESDWRSLVKRDDLDLISIVTPVVTHCEMTLAALDAGKSVLCEKPMAMNAGEARHMMERAQAAGVLAHIDHELRFLPGRIKMRELIRAGAIGKIRHVALRFRSDSRLDHNRPWNWWSDKNQGGGALGAIGSHVIDAFRWLLETEVSEVTANLATHVPKRTDAEGQTREVTTDDEANLMLRFADSELTEGATGSASMSLVEAGAPDHCLEIFGSTGALMIQENGDLWQASAGDGDWRRVDVTRADLAPGMRDSGWGRGFTIFSRKIVEAWRDGRTSVAGAATFADGYRTQLVLDAARKSHESGCWERVDFSSPFSLWEKGRG